MASRTVFVDDLDGKTDAAGTTTFSLNGNFYEIDLNDAHAAQLENALAKYIEKGRKATSVAAPRTRRSGGQRPTTDKAQLQAMREWARANGYTVSDRGRVSQEIQDAFHANS